MRRDRSRSPMRGLLLFLLGALVGANAMYFAMTHDIGRRLGLHDGPDRGARVEAPLPVPHAEESGSETSIAPAFLPPPPTAVPDAAAPSVPPPEAAAPVPGSSGLLVPVQGVTAAQLHDTFSDARGASRVHDAIDIMAPAGTPVLAVADGQVEKLFDSKQGGLTIYQFNPERTQAWYYAHLQSYAPGLAEKQQVKRGQVIGYVGSTGNASPEAPHLHFAIFVLGPEQQWWKGTAVNPYPQLGGTPR